MTAEKETQAINQIKLEKKQELKEAQLDVLFWQRKLVQYETLKDGSLIQLKAAKKRVQELLKYFS